MECHVKCLGCDISVRQHSKSMSIELSATSRDCCDMLESLLKVAQRSMKQTNKKGSSLPIQLCNNSCFFVVFFFVFFCCFFIDKKLVRIPNKTGSQTRPRKYMFPNSSTYLILDMPKYIYIKEMLKFINEMCQIILTLVLLKKLREHAHF